MPTNGRTDIASRAGDETPQRQDLADFFHRIFSASIDGILLTAPDGRTFAANPAACAMLGRSESELQAIGRNGVLAARPASASMLEERRRFGRVRQETELVRADGTTFPCEVSSSTYIDPNGEERAVVILRDVSDRRAAERAQRQSEERLRLALDGGALGLWDWNARTGIVTVNGRWMSMLGLPPDDTEVDIDFWNGRVHPDDLPVLEELVRRVIMNPAGRHFEAEIRARHVDGQYRWILDKGAVVERDAGGNPLRIVGTHMDITDRKLAEATILQSERRFRSAIEASPVSIVLGDDAGRLTYANPQFIRTFGYRLEEVPTLEEWWMRAQPDPDYRRWVGEAWQEREAAAAAPAGGQFSPLEMKVTCRDGSLRTVVAQAAVLEGSSRNTRLLMFIDVTEQRLLEGRIMDAVTHEQHRLGMDLHDGLGQELTGLAMLLNGSARSLCRADPQTIETELLRLAEIARQALITARAIAHGLSPINLENGGLEPALRRLIETTQTTSGAVIKLRTRGVEMSSHVDDRMGEPLFRIVQEALTNALRHGAASEIDVVLQRVRNALHLTIADNGTGVASGDPSGGLGIRIMRYRAHAIGGHLEIESRPGGGTLVRCVIPVRPPSR